MLFRRKRNRDPFWSRSASQGDVVDGPAPTTEDIQPGSGEGWRQLWEHDGPTAPDDALWAEFLSGDAAKKREVDWLLSESR